MDPLELQLLNDFQRGFPLCPRPFAVLAAQLETTEAFVLTALRRFIADGTVSRVGPAFRPHSIGVSTLAALAVPEDRLETTAAWINRFTEINHNYERVGWGEEQTPTFHVGDYVGVPSSPQPTGYGLYSTRDNPGMGYCGNPRVAD